MRAQNRFGEGQTRVYKTGQKYLCLSLDFPENRTWESIQYIYLGIIPGIRREGVERVRKRKKKNSNFQQLPFNSVGTSCAVYEIPSEVGEAGTFTHGFFFPLAEDCPMSNNSPSGVCSYDVVKGPQRENQKPHDVRGR